ncbi:hypothetical protein GCK72_016695 [Caenorhabditis remanei]|uniref:G protein-coupled receptor n=1 Tax=Caenorhabditis remanei TaxID=31234 RepID=A0A6A5G555_CAERE|nr:hypothetical protein GCK72_016695 [Caenorhabditis remanei]KAF1750148.1 hypothetical protein GCK72_016695 [Caenorhabditis remanei]
MFWVNTVWITGTILSIVFNAIVMFLAIDRQHHRLESNILVVDPKFQYVIDTYAPYIIDMKSATIPMNILLLEGLWAFFLFAVIVFYTIYRVFYALYTNRRIVSERVTKAQKSIVITLFIYGTTFFGLIGFPTVGASSAIVAGVDLRYLPLGGIYFISISIPAILFCLINILTVSPYRRAIRNLFRRLISPLSLQSSIATVSDNRQAVVAPVPQSLFTRPRETPQQNNY